MAGGLHEQLGILWFKHAGAGKSEKSSKKLGRQSQLTLLSQEGAVIHAQPHPTALAQGSLGFASDPRIPPGPSVTIGASHMKAPSYPHLTLLSQSTLVSLKALSFPEGVCLRDGLLPEPISLRTETPPSAACSRTKRHLT